MNNRKERDSNPRYPCGYTSLAGTRFRPLSHLSKTETRYVERRKPIVPTDLAASESDAYFLIFTFWRALSTLFDVTEAILNFFAELLLLRLDSKRKAMPGEKIPTIFDLL